MDSDGVESGTRWFRHSASGHRRLDGSFLGWRAGNFRLKPGRYVWSQVARGSAMLNGTLLRAGDGAAVNQEEILEFKAVEAAELLLFDLA